MTKMVGIKKEGIKKHERSMIKTDTIRRGTIEFDLINIETIS